MQFKNVISKNSVSRIGGVTTGTQRTDLTVDIEKQTLADVQTWIVGTTRDEVKQQMQNNNPPQNFLVDNRTGKAVERATKKVEVFFDQSVSVKRAMALVEFELWKSIYKLTKLRTGNLADMDMGWHWYFYESRTDKVGKIVTKGSDINMRKGATLAYISRTPYAFYVWNERRFTEDAVNKLKRKQPFKPFSIWANASEKFKGRALNRKGLSPMIVIRLK